MASPWSMRSPASEHTRSRRSGEAAHGHLLERGGAPRRRPRALSRRKVQRRPSRSSVADLVVEPRPVGDLPGQRLARARPPRGPAPRPMRSAPRVIAELDRAPLAGVQRVAQRRADGLVDGRLPRRLPVASDRASRDVGVVDVAGEQRRRSRAAPPRRPRGDRRSSRPLERAQRVAERGPVLEVEALAQALGRAPRPARPTRRRRPPRSRPRGSASRGRGTTGSEVPSSRWSKSPRVHSLDAVPLLGVDHRARAGLEHAPGARVHHHDARAPDVALVAPARAGHLAVGAEGEVAHDRRRRRRRPRGPRGSTRPPSRSSGEQVAEVLVAPVGREGRRRCARPTSPCARMLARPSRATCSSRR